MSNPIRGEYDLTFLSPPRKWRITMNEQASVEAKLEIITGEKIFFNSWLQKMTQWTTRDWLLLLWAGCYHYDKTVTDEALGAEMTEDASIEFETIVMKWTANRYPVEAKKKFQAAFEALMALGIHGKTGSEQPTESASPQTSSGA